MKLIFFGTPEYVLPVLKALAKKHEIVAVVTQPPQPTGRKQLLTYSPVDTWAYKRKIPVFRDFNKPFPSADLGILAAYGKIIPEAVLVQFPRGILNIHPSLLPKYRGASPISAAIAAGETETGVSVIKLDRQVDHGPIVTQFKEAILPADTAASLRTRLFDRAAAVLLQALPAYLAGKIKLKPQNESQATFTKLLKKDDGFIDLKNKTPEETERFIRAMFPWPCAWTKLSDDRRLKLLPNSMVQLEGKNPISLKQFREAYPKLDFYK